MQGLRLSEDGAYVTREVRQKIVESFGGAPAKLSLALRGIPKKMWLYKPATDRWSIHEIIVHLADSEASGYVRCRQFIAEPGRSEAEFDAERWARSLGYYYQSTREALEIIRRLRKMTYQLLITLPETVWSHRVENPIDGSTSLEDWVERQERHIPHHIEEIKQIYEIWLSTHPTRKSATTLPQTTAPTRMISHNAGI